MNIMFGKAGASLSKVTSTVLKTAAIKLTSAALPATFRAEVYDASAGSSKKDVVMTGTVGSGQIAYASSGITLVGVFKEDGTEIKDNNTSITDATKWANVTGLTSGERAYIKYNIAVSKSEIVISNDSFPGTYYVTGDTYARSDVDGKDQFFQFIIPKAKMQSENTITLEAEGDPSVFNMSLKVLRPDSGDMMKLVQYDLTAPAAG